MKMASKAALLLGASLEPYLTPRAVKKSRGGSEGFEVRTNEAAFGSLLKPGINTHQDNDEPLQRQCH